MGFERIVLEFRDAEKYGILTRKAFNGRFIYSKESPLRVGPDPEYPDDSNVDTYIVAETAKGAVVITKDSHDLHFDRQSPTTFRVFKSLIEAAGDCEFTVAARSAIEKRGVPIEELDI